METVLRPRVPKQQLEYLQNLIRNTVVDGFKFDADVNMDTYGMDYFPDAKEFARVEVVPGLRVNYLVEQVQYEIEFDQKDLPDLILITSIVGVSIDYVNVYSFGDEALAASHAPESEKVS